MIVHFTIRSFALRTEQFVVRLESLCKFLDRSRRPKTIPTFAATLFYHKSISFSSVAVNAKLLIMIS